MAYRVEIGLKPTIRDARGEKIKRRIIDDLNIIVDSVVTVDVYTVDAAMSAPEIEKAASGPFLDPIIQEFSIGKPLRDDFDWAIEVGYKAGVTDNIGRTAREAVELLLQRKFNAWEGVYTSVLYLIRGKLTKEQAERIATGLLANTLIQRFEIKDQSSWNPEVGMGVTVPRMAGRKEYQVAEINLQVSDKELMRISADRVLALTLKEMKAIRNYAEDPGVREERKKIGLGENLTDCELEALAQTWSEHCKHKIFNGLIEYQDEEGKVLRIDSLFDTYIKRSTEEIRQAMGEKDWCVSVFKDNAGIMRFNEDWNIVFKVETHNSPSALDPYGGALTGIVGVNRDPFGTGKGAKLIFNVDTFCFAPPDYSKPLPPRLLHPKRIYEGVREGVEHGGNKSGIPTVNGSIVFDERYAGKPLVYCGTGGIMPRNILGEPSHEKQAMPGDLIVMTGGRIGKDGIHGATFSSEELHEESPTSAVQIGDPITQKRMTDFLLRARDLGLYHAITDNGAGGLSSSVGEMARDCHGCRIYLERAPLKYAGLDPWEILLSEAQERMTLAVSPEKIGRFLELARRMEVEATVLGEFTDSGKFHILYHGQTAAYLDMDFLHNGLPRMELKARWEKKVHPEPAFNDPPDLTAALKKVLSRYNICSKESVIRQYDHEVQGGCVIKPLVGAHNDGPSDATVLRPLLESWEGIVVSSGICSRYSDIDTYHMMACAIDEAIRNNLATGGNLKQMAGLDNFCWCDPIQSDKTPDGEYKLAQLVRANQALYHYTRAFGVPCISGKDSMKNDYLIGNTKISIPPTVLFSAVSVVSDVRRCITMDAKRSGDRVYILGETYNDMGGSEYYALYGFIGNQVPKVNAPRAKALYEALGQAIQRGLAASCHDCSDGGLGVALAETALAGALGMEVDLRKVPSSGVNRNDVLLFSESQSRFVVAVHPEHQRTFEECLKGNVFAEIGSITGGSTFTITGLHGKTAVRANIFELKEAWQRPLRF
ncbi:MAG: phosphoribosylformylglycinamidine synthase subunit PurL [Deltaproteobacteria bacterium]|nr:phosphoribosylformylglycinamidine synthase subunit PurL [Deltaproteobacteria bacterium]